jgi:glutamyl-tRNA reductase
MEDRNAEAVKGERIVDEAVIHFRKWFESLAVVPTIVALREKIEQIVHAEATRTIQGLPGSSRTDEAIKKMSQAITNKFLHDPTLFLKRDGMHADKSVYIDVVRRMFKLDE